MGEPSARGSVTVAATGSYGLLFSIGRDRISRIGLVAGCNWSCCWLPRGNWPPPGVADRFCPSLTAQRFRRQECLTEFRGKSQQELENRGQATARQLGARGPSCRSGTERGKEGVGGAGAGETGAAGVPAPASSSKKPAWMPAAATGAVWLARDHGWSGHGTREPAMPNRRESVAAISKSRSGSSGFAKVAQFLTARNIGDQFYQFLAAALFGSLSRQTSPATNR